MRSSMLGLISAIAMASAEDLLPCGNAFYVASQYTCYNTTLCPVVNGQPTEPCGADCYLPTMYSCNANVLAPPAPSVDGTSTFLVVVFQSPYNQTLQAGGLVFRIVGGRGGGPPPPATYCPDQVARLGKCPPGKETVWTCSSGYCGLNVEVPGGQQIYVGPNQAVGYTQAHSASAPPGSQFSGFSLKNGELQFANSGFRACPPADSSAAPQLYVSQPGNVLDSKCYNARLFAATWNESGFAAWQYT